MNFSEIINAIVEKAKQENVDNIRFDGFGDCLSRNSSTKEKKALSSVFLSEEEYDGFVKELFKEYDAKGLPVKKHVKTQGYDLVFAGAEGLVSDSGKYALSVRLIKQKVA